MSGWERLSPRQQQIAEWVAQGFSSKHIARLAALSPLTVRTHRRAIFALLQVHSVAELARQRLAMAAPDTPSE